MTTEPENLVLVYLRRIDQRQERMEQAVSPNCHRIAGVVLAQRRNLRPAGDETDTFLVALASLPMRSS
jgi:hypothetical protein